MFNSSSPTVDLPHVRQSGFRNLAKFCSWIPDHCAFESRIQFKESRIPANNWNPESKGFTPWSPESKTTLDYLSWSELIKQKFNNIRCSSTFKFV